MTIANKDRFPHHYNLMKLGETIEAEKYYNDNYSEFIIESDFIMENTLERFRIGGNKKIHNEYSNRR